MGQQISIFEKKRKILLAGLDGAGKTTMIYKLTGSSNDNHTGISQIEYKNMHIISIDLPVRSKVKHIMHHYYTDVDFVIFIVDSNDKERISEACEELHNLMSEEKLKYCKLLVLGNKQDLSSSMDVTLIREKLKLEEIKLNFFILPCSVSKDEGIIEGLEMLH